MSSSTPDPDAITRRNVCVKCGSALANVMGTQCPRCLLNLASSLGLPQEPEADAALLDAFQVRSFGDYELLNEVARGGMGVVYRARQISLGREVALKMILAGERAGRGSLQLFQREAHAAANLHHPSIVPVYEIGEHETQHYFTMRFVPGGKTIADWAATRRGQFREIARAAAQVARAVAYAHTHGVLHRDLKPSNILWDHQAGPQVTDFGLAKLMDTPASTLTLSAKAIGSPSYMAPEQASGRVEQITTSTDIYGIGAVLYELLSGRPPFSGPSLIETMRRAAEDEPPPLPEVPKDLRTICFKCLEKKPEDRYESAASLADDLERFVRGEPVSAVPLSPIQSAWRWAQRHALVASLIALCVVSLLGGVAGVFWQWRKAEHARRSESLALQHANATVLDLYTHGAARETDFTRAALWYARAAMASSNPTQVSENLARHAVWQRESHTAVRAFASGIGPVQQLFWNRSQTALLGRSTNRAAIWNVLSEAAWAVEGISEFESAAWANRDSWLVVAAGGVVRVLDFPGGRERARTNFLGTSPQLVVSPDDRWVLVGGKASFLWNVTNGEMRPLPATAAPPRLVQFSNNGKFVMLCVESTVGIVAVDAPAEFLFPTVPCRIPTMPGFLGNDAFYTCLVDNQTAVLDVQTGSVLENHANTTTRSCTPRLASRDGRYIVTMFAPMLERATGYKKFPVHLSAIADADFSRDGSWMISGGSDSALLRWPLPGGEPPQQIGWHQEGLLAVAISPDQRFIASAQGGGSLVKVWRLAMPPPARELRIAGDSSVRLSASGRWLLPNGTTHENFHLRRTRVFSVNTAQPLGGEITTQSDILDADFSPDENWIAVVCSTMRRRRNHDFINNPGSGHLQIWDWRAGRRLGVPMEMLSEPRGVAVHPSGRWVAVYGAAGELVEVEVATRQLRVLRPATRPHSAAYLAHNGRCRYSPDGRWLIGWGMRDEPVLWDRETRKAVSRPFEPSDWVNDVDFQGNIMATVSSQSQIQFLMLTDLSPAAAGLLDNDRLYLGRFSADGTYFLTAGRGQVAHIWDWRRGQLTAPALRHEGEIFSGVFIPGTECVVTGGLDNKIRLWDRRTGLPMRPPISTSRGVLDLAVTPDGRTLVRGSQDTGVIKLYDMAELLPQATLDVEGALLLAEIDAAAEIIHGGVEPLNASAWFAKWRQFRARHPEWHRW